MNKFFLGLKKEKDNRFIQVVYSTSIKTLRTLHRYKIIFHEDNYPLKIKRGYFIDNIIYKRTTRTTSLINFEKRLYE